MPARLSAGTEAPCWQSRAPSCPRLRLRLQLHDALLQRGFLGLCAAGGTALRRRSRRARGTPRGTVRKGPGERFAATGWRTALPDQANEGPASRLPKGPRRCGGVAGPQRRGPEAVDSLEQRGEAAPGLLVGRVCTRQPRPAPRRDATIQVCPLASLVLSYSPSGASRGARSNHNNMHPFRLEYSVTRKYGTSFQ